MTFELDSNNHSVFSLNDHLILVIKYRKKVLTNQKMLLRLREIAEYIGISHNVKIKEMNGIECFLRCLIL